MYRIEKRRKKGVGLLVFLCAFAVGLGVGLGGIKMHQSNAKSLQPLAAQSDAPLTAAPTQPPVGQPASLALTAEDEAPPKAEHFFVSIEQGDLCVFTVEPNGDKRFSHKLSIEPDALPPADRAMLADGLYLNSKADLLAFYEDFSS